MNVWAYNATKFFSSHARAAHLFFNRKANQKKSKVEDKIY